MEAPPRLVETRIRPRLGRSEVDCFPVLLRDRVKVNLGTRQQRRRSSIIKRSINNFWASHVGK